jgi:hypothetical protein
MIEPIKSIRYGSVGLIFTYKAAFLVGYYGALRTSGLALDANWRSQFCPILRYENIITDKNPQGYSQEGFTK